MTGNLIKLYPTDTAMRLIREAYDRDQEKRTAIGLRPESFSGWTLARVMDGIAR